MSGEWETPECGRCHYGRACAAHGKRATTFLGARADLHDALLNVWRAILAALTDKGK